LPVEPQAPQNESVAIPVVISSRAYHQSSASRGVVHIERAEKLVEDLRAILTSFSTEAT
jgi:hypothetical protein